MGNMGNFSEEKMKTFLSKYNRIETANINLFVQEKIVVANIEDSRIILMLVNYSDCSITNKF